MTAGLALVSLPELAAAWGLSVRTVQRWIAQDRAAGHAVRETRHRRNRARRIRLYPLEDALAVLARHRPCVVPVKRKNSLGLDATLQRDTAPRRAAGA
jgi:hypothetical protein